MTQKPHRIVQNDLRYSVLPAPEYREEDLSHTGSPPRLSRKREGNIARSNQTADASAVGLYRTPVQDGKTNDVRVLINGCSFFISEAEYRRRKCEPFFENLPWHRPFDAQTPGRKL